ncbi:hypothetical protein VNI00_005466 [Paramarasmius palmivorus]|uniref:Major facilitator superfamily (MFS) profile domain-containing protein n=1 Tax=Paramarasmius palmivorus TaxID=297713 RepID=A0AAW0DDW9_9AGAR
MPSEPIEAEFAVPPALSLAQEEEFRQLEQEGPLHSSDTLGNGKSHGKSHKKSSSVGDEEAAYTKEGINIVAFESGTGEDPREWSKFRKCMEGPTADLATTQEIVNLTVTCFVIGFGIGPLFFAPLSEVVGRTPMYRISLFFYFIFTLPSALAQNAATLVVGRQLAGLAASAPMCNVGGSIADIWSIEERGVPMAIFSFTIFMGPCIGPLVGGWIGQYAGWRWIYWVLFIFSGICFFLTLFIPETLAPVILRRKAAKLRKETGDDSYKTLEELERKPLADTLKIALLRPLVMLFTEPIVILFSFSSA